VGESDRLQWHCPPLRAWISLRQCQANRHRVRVAAADDERGRIWLHECVKCKGVAWWAAETGQRPRELAPDVLNAQARPPATIAERYAHFDRPVRRARFAED
jgi:hypothetical protein